MKFRALRKTMLCLAFLPASSHAAELIVHVRNVENGNGFVCAAVHRSESGYLDRDQEQAFRLARVPAHKPEVAIIFRDLPPGNYAIKVFHDENGDGKLNRNFLGAPTEAYGLSNNLRARFSLPRFADALIEVRNSLTETQIDLSRQ